MSNFWTSFDLQLNRGQSVDEVIHLAVGRIMHQGYDIFKSKQTRDRLQTANLFQTFIL